MHVLSTLLSLLFPPRRTESLIAELSPGAFAAACEPRRLTDAVALAAYKDPAVRAAIHEIKFHNNERGAELLGTLLASWIRREVQGPALLVPIPLSPARLRKRGYNQIARVLRHVEGTNALIDTHLLKRIRNTAPQTSLAKAERLANLKGAFRTRRGAPERIRGAHIILVDDVYTTGATMRAAKAALLPHHPASVTCVALAH